MRISRILIAVAATVLLPALALAETDSFDITLGADGGMVSGSSTGYPGGLGEWYLYPSGWWNTWFYNQPFKPHPWYKEVTANWTVSLVDPTHPGQIEFVINWATDIWSGMGLQRPPLPQDFPGPELEPEMIGRDLKLDCEIPAECAPTDFECGPYVLPVDYNPEWVSIDVRGTNVMITGQITHECIPEPATVALLALGGGVALLRRRRK